MKILIITVAGMSSRFSKSVSKDVIKCLYNEDSFSDSLIYRILHQPCEFDKYIIVGGYRYSELESAINIYFPELKDRILVIENKYYEKYGSGYSLYCGMKKAMEYCFDEIVFAEGDLFVDTPSYLKVFGSPKNVISCNSEPILANKSVAYYFDLNENLHYIYDTCHSAFEIKEPFLSIYNSGQIWKFINKDKICEIYNDMNLNDWEGTNLVFIEKYFNAISPDDLEIVRFKTWINCNTVGDFHKIKEIDK